MSRRDAIKMSGEEVRSFLEEERVVVATTNGVRGWPHSMPLWFLPREAGETPDGEPAAPPGVGGIEVWAWTFAKSQKVRNLERDARTTLLVEAGETYDQLRGVMIESVAILYRESEVCREFGLDLSRRYSGSTGELSDEAVAAVEAQASKRVVMRFHPVRIATWDHRKLGGGY